MRLVWVGSSRKIAVLASMLVFDSWFLLEGRRGVRRLAQLDSSKNDEPGLPKVMAEVAGRGCSGDLFVLHWRYFDGLVEGFLASIRAVADGDWKGLVGARQDSCG